MIYDSPAVAAAVLSVTSFNPVSIEISSVSSPCAVSKLVEAMSLQEFRNQSLLTTKELTFLPEHEDGPGPEALEMLDFAPISEQLFYDYSSTGGYEIYKAIAISLAKH